MITRQILLSISLLISTTLHATEPLQLYVWEDSLGAEVQRKWESDNAQPLLLHYFDNDDERNKLMLNSESLPFDVVVFDNVSANVYGQQGALVDISELPNRQHISPRWLNACGDHAVPYFWGVLGLAYRQSKLAVPPSSWRELIYPSSDVKGHISLIEDTIETLLPVMFVLGYPTHTGDTAPLREAHQILLELQPDVLTYEYPISYVRSHDDADSLFLSMAYSGDQYSLNQYLKEEDWQFVVPSEGTHIWVDCIAINSASLQQERAKKLLNDLMDPTIAAQNALEVMAATPNLSALALLPESYTQDSTLFPSQEIINKSVIDRRLTPNNINLRAKIINNVVKSHEAQY